MHIKLHVFPDMEALNAGAAALLAEYLPRPGGLMLAGGKTPLEIYRRVSALPVLRATLFLSDERNVPATDPHSNYGRIHPCFLCATFMRVETEHPLQQAAERFHDALLKLDSVPLGFLGLGTDGHTASLFSSEDAARRDSRLAIPVIKKEKPDRISVTPALLNRIGRIIILAAGETKRDVIRTLLDRPETIPAGIALADHPRVELWTEQRI